MRLRSFKVQFDPSPRIRVVPSCDTDGGPFTEPGIDVLGPEAADLFERLGPLREWFSAREPGVEVRSLSFDFSRGRALATLRPSHGGPGAQAVHAIRALRVDEPACPDLFDLARALEPELARVAERVLGRRPTRGPGVRPA